MVFNFTNNYQFRTRLTVDNQVLETVDSTKLLGTVISNDLRRDKNTNRIVKRAYAKMELVRKLSGFGAPISDLKNIYVYVMPIRAIKLCVSQWTHTRK